MSKAEKMRKKYGVSKAGKFITDEMTMHEVDGTLKWTRINITENVASAIIEKHDRSLSDWERSEYLFLETIPRFQRREPIDVYISFQGNNWYLYNIIYI